MRLSEVTYGAAISACEKGAQWEKALELLNAMASSGLRRNAIVYSAAISACGAGRQWDKALELLDEMASVKVSPNTITATPRSRRASAPSSGGGGDLRQDGTPASPTTRRR